MPTCNIDSRGKALRLVMGMIMCLLGAILFLAWARGSGTWWRWPIAAAPAAMGVFQIYEGWAGWCVIRAMGIKTRI